VISSQSNHRATIAYAGRAESNGRPTVIWRAPRHERASNWRWTRELFFKELKSTLGFHQYRFRQFERVEGWDELIQVTFLYLEWHRARQLPRRDLPEAKKKWWRWQRTHGLCLAVRQAAEQADLEEIAERLTTPTGLQRLRRLLKRALPKEAVV
jgi:hypothetical protein